MDAIHLIRSQKLGANTEHAPSEDATLDAIGSKSDNSSQPHHHEIPIVDKNYYAKLALLCVENAVHMGGRTVLNLTPPGRPRHDIAKFLIDRKRDKKSSVPSIRRASSFGQTFTRVASSSSVINDVSVFDRVMDDECLRIYSAAEDDYLLNPDGQNSSDENLQEEPSSGDEDALDLQSLVDGDQEDDILREPLYSISDTTLSASSLKRAFNYRKLKWFDSITAKDRAEARAYLQQELRNLRGKDSQILTKHLKQMQRREKRKRDSKSERRNMAYKDRDMSSDTDDEGDDTALRLGITKLPSNMTPHLSAALVVESLSLNPLESLEGMSKCYEGIVAAGSAIVKDSLVDKKLTKQEVIAALTPLLITTLAEASGETIRSLANLKKMCGTKRYQRRFIQRIAPSLVRPANAAQWCLRHQNDMESILYAVELMFDFSEEIFRVGWFERGKTILADSMRAETLKAAAIKLKKMTNSNPDNFMSPFTSGAHRRARSLISGPNLKDVQEIQRDELAEWEILAVDRQIRDSIKNFFQNDWTRINLINAPPRDGESSHHHKKNGGITSRKKNSSTSSAASDADSVAGSVDASIHSPPRLNKQQLFHSTSHSQPETRKSQAPTSPRTIESKDITSRRISKGSITDESPPSTPKSMSNDHYSHPSPSRTPVTEGASPGSFNKILSPRYYLEGNGAPIQPLMSPGGSPAPPISPKKSLRRNDGSRLSQGSPGSISAAQATYLRTLTSTAAERKRTVAACRALRAQIARFEDAFEKVHGRAPKGATERAPLQSTYSQYREWKRAIRADAASRIQAMYRGARLRMILIQDPQFTNIILNRAGRPPIEEYLPKMPENILSSNNELNRLARQVKPTVPADRRDSTSFTNETIRVLDAPEQRPFWSKQRSSTEQSLAYSQVSDAASVISNPFSPIGDNSVASNTSHDYQHLTMAELQVAKRELKQRLKKYDMDFFKAHGRMPVKAEKEPIRGLYEQYNSLKNQIVAVEQDPSLAPTPSLKQNWNMHPGTTSSNSESTGLTVNAPRPSRSRRPETPPNIPSVSSRMDMSTLKIEKQKLHQKLRDYEKGFFRTNGRQVSSFSDIRPVASDYKLYKEIKRKIMELQNHSAGEN